MGIINKINYMYSKHPIKSWAITTVFAFTFAYTFVKGIEYLDRYALTKSWDWNEQEAWFDNQSKISEAKWKKFNDLYDRFLQHADTDKQGGISFAEQANAWKKLGYTGPFLETREIPGKYSQFPRININDMERLETAVQMYENEAKVSELK